MEILHARCVGLTDEADVAIQKLCISMTFNVPRNCGAGFGVSLRAGRLPSSTQGVLSQAIQHMLGSAMLCYTMYARRDCSPLAKLRKFPF